MITIADLAQASEVKVHIRRLLIAATSLFFAASFQAKAGGIIVHGRPITPSPDFVLNNLRPLLTITSGCKDKPTSVSVQAVEKSDNIKANASGTSLISGWIKEQWLFHACSNDIPMYVRYEFMPDGQTKYVFSAR